MKTIFEYVVKHKLNNKSNLSDDDIKDINKTAIVYNNLKVYPYDYEAGEDWLSINIKDKYTMINCLCEIIDKLNTDTSIYAVYINARHKNKVIFHLDAEENLQLGFIEFDAADNYKYTYKFVTNSDYTVKHTNIADIVKTIKQRLS